MLLGCAGIATSETDAPCLLGDAYRNCVLQYVQKGLDPVLFERISSGYDTLVTNVESFEDMADESNTRFEANTRWFLDIKRRKACNFYIIDNTDICRPELNMLLKLCVSPLPEGKVHLKYECMYIPIPG